MATPRGSFTRQRSIIGPPVAGGAGGPRSGSANAMLQQHETNRVGNAHVSRGKEPSFWIGVSEGGLANNYSFVTWAGYVLPYLEAENVSRQYDPNSEYGSTTAIVMRDQEVQTYPFLGTRPLSKAASIRPWPRFCSLERGGLLRRRCRH